MKKILQHIKIQLLLLLFPFLVMAQSTDQNYIKTTVYKVPTASGIATPAPEEAAQQVTYFDGLGRPIQQVAHKQAGNGTDLVTHIEYDAFGRQTKEYLPVASGQTLDFHTVDASSIISFYTGIGQPTNYPYSEKELEASPLNRVLKQAAPGENWRKGSGHEIKFDYQTNTETDSVRFMLVTTTWNNTTRMYNPALLVKDYHDQQLYKTITKDENWQNGNDHTTEEFKDKEGHVVLKRTYDAGIAHDTYYAYDEYGNLTFVIPPLVTLDDDISSDELDGLCYQYQYDHRNRLVAKKLPGKQWEYIAYNSQDKPIATGPELDPFGGTGEGWLITKYDIFGRVVYTGWYDGTSVDETGRVSIENQLTANWYETATTSPTTIDNVAVNYTNATAPTNIVLLTVNYYDHYNIPGLPTGTITNTIEGENVSINVKGLATGSWTRVLDGSTAPATGILSYMLYDSKGRVISSYTGNHLDGYTRVDSKLDFTGKALYTLTYHKRTANDAVLTIKDSYTYTFGDRLRYHIHQINHEPQQILTNNEYDALGQLILKRVGGENGVNAPLQYVNYKYNIRGWLTDINNAENLGDDLFAFKIGYDQLGDNLNHTIDPLYNGNIVETYWQSAKDHVQRKYSYRYDALNRMKDAIYQRPHNNIPVTNSYNENLTYDKNGNIVTLNRNGVYDDPVYEFEMDNLSYTYSTTNPNQLMKVSDSTNNPNGFRDGTNTDDDYSYDDNGNMLTDKNKGITQNIRYNHLNLPVSIDFGGNGNISYLYTATGQKLMKEVVQDGVGIRTEYLDGFQYENGVLEFFPTAEGYVKFTRTEAKKFFNYVYNYTDHLGNIRLSYGWDNNDNVLKILEENHYYPFGLKHDNYNLGRKEFDKYGIYPIVELEECVNCSYKYKYNGKEYQDELGLNMTAMDYRQYDNAIGRFNSIDALAEMNYFSSPYIFANNNPIYWADPTGLLSASFINSLWSHSGSGTTTWINDGGGTFSNEDGSGMIDQETGEYTGFETLREVKISAHKTSRSSVHFVSNLVGLAQNKAYSYGRFYEGFRDRAFSKQVDDMQGVLDWLGSVDPTGIVDGVNSLWYLGRGQYGNAAIAGLAIIPFGDLAKGLKYTKSTMKMGREIHATYKVAEHAPELKKFKEFTGIKGIRPDFVDFNTNTIYELKPYNPRAMQAGEKQLEKYKAAFEEAYPGTIWNTVLDTY